MDATGLLDIRLVSLDADGREAALLEALDLGATNVQAVLVAPGGGPDSEKQARAGCCVRGALALFVRGGANDAPRPPRPPRPP